MYANNNEDSCHIFASFLYNAAKLLLTNFLEKDVFSLFQQVMKRPLLRMWPCLYPVVELLLNAVKAIDCID